MILYLITINNDCIIFVYEGSHTNKMPCKHNKINSTIHFPNPLKHFFLHGVAGASPSFCWVKVRFTLNGLPVHHRANKSFIFENFKLLKDTTL